MATLRNTAVSLLHLAGHANIAAAAPCHHNRQPNKIIMLLTRTNPTKP